MSGAHITLAKLFAGSWAFVYCVFGMSYIYSITLSAGAAQMCAVVSAFLAFCVAGAYQPLLPQIAGMFDGRGWMIPALSPVRWLYGFLITAEAPHLTDLSKAVAQWQLRNAGYDLRYLGTCQSNLICSKAGSMAVAGFAPPRHCCCWASSSDSWLGSVSSSTSTRRPLAGRVSLRSRASGHGSWLAVSSRSCWGHS